jgi:hypothetical protein
LAIHDDSNFVAIEEENDFVKLFMETQKWAANPEQFPSAILQLEFQEELK